MGQTNCPYPIGTLKIPGQPEIYVPCKKWECPWCGAVNRFRVLERLRAGFPKGVRARFLTLTLREGTDNRLIGKYWNRLRASLRRRGFRFFRYFWVKELQKNGTVHMHMIIDAYVPVKILKHLWYLATEKTAFIVDIRAVRGKIHNTAAYMTKYMTKAVSNHEKGVRRYQFSRHQDFRRVRNVLVLLDDLVGPGQKPVFELKPVFDREHRKNAFEAITWRDEQARMRAIGRGIIRELQRNGLKIPKEA